MTISLTAQPTQLPKGFFWHWCDRCDGNPECGLCGGLGYFSLLWLLPLRTHKHGLINFEVC